MKLIEALTLVFKTLYRNLLQYCNLKAKAIFCDFLLSCNLSGQPIIDWEKTFGVVNCWQSWTQCLQ